MTTPARIMAATVTWPVAKTRALGGVATGSMKAQLAAMATAPDTVTRSMPVPAATVAVMGDEPIAA